MKSQFLKDRKVIGILAKNMIHMLEENISISLSEPCSPGRSHKRVSRQELAPYKSVVFALFTGVEAKK